MSQNEVEQQLGGRNSMCTHSEAYQHIAHLERTEFPVSVEEEDDMDESGSENLGLSTC